VAVADQILAAAPLIHLVVPEARAVVALEEAV
jgi:hypothetical protein